MNKLFIGLLFSLILLSCNNKSDRNAESLSENVFIEERDTEDGITDIPIIASYYMKGIIDNKYAFNMTFSVDSNRVDGSYQYEGQKASISIGGAIKGKKVRINEVVYKDGEYRPNGAYFDGIFNYDQGEITGTWYSADGKRSLPFTIENPYGTGYPQFGFKVNLKRKHYESGYVSLSVSALHVLNKKTGEETIFSVDARPLESVFSIFQEDYNFDGYPDIALMEFIPSYPPNKFLFWLYDPEKKMYSPTDILDAVYTLPDIDYKDSTTMSTTIWHNEVHEQTYKYDGHKWVWISDEVSKIGEE